MALLTENPLAGSCLPRKRAGVWQGTGFEEIILMGCQVLSDDRWNIEKRYSSLQFPWNN